MRALGGDLMCANNVPQASAAGGLRSGPATRDTHVHGAVLPPLHLLPLPGVKDGRAGGPCERGALGAGAHDRGVQEPGQDTGL